VPFVVDKARRRRVAVAKARKPGWQDTRPEDEELREAWEIAREEQERFARNLTIVVGALAAPSILRAIRGADPGDVPAIMATIPFIGSGRPGIENVWGPMRRRFAEQMTNVIGSAGAQEWARLGIDGEFSAQNTFSQRFIQNRAQMITNTISDSSRLALQESLQNAVNQGLHPRSLAKLIERDIGLIPREAKAVDNFLAARLAEGKTMTRAREMSEKYARRLRRQRGLRIARTELNTAQNRGRLDSWRVAQEAGTLPPGGMKKWVAAVGSPRTCEICLELAGMDPIPVDQAWESSFVGAVMHPGEDVHPNDRCTLIYVQPEA
jgi:hypothetical protein